MCSAAVEGRSGGCKRQSLRINNKMREDARASQRARMDISFIQSTCLTTIYVSDVPVRTIRKNSSVDTSRMMANARNANTARGKH